MCHVGHVVAKLWSKEVEFSGCRKSRGFDFSYNIQIKEKELKNEPTQVFYPSMIETGSLRDRAKFIM